MDQADQRKNQHHVLQPHGRDHISAAAHQHGGEKIDEKWISKAYAGIRWVFRWQIVTLRKAVADLQMQRQVAKILVTPVKMPSLCSNAARPKTVPNRMASAR